MIEPIKRYWKLYGGWTEFLGSPYLFAAIILLALEMPIWRPGQNPEVWSSISISVLPSLMGFSVAAMAVLLAFSHPSSLRAVTQRGKDDSYFVKTVANLFHFLMTQVVALLLAILAKAYNFWLLSMFGVLALNYAIFVSLAAAGQLLNTARIVNKAVWLPDSPRDTPKSDSAADQQTEDQPRSGTKG